MNKIYCELHLFDLYQKIYMVDPETGVKTVLGSTTLEDLPATITAIGHDRKLYKVLLSGNSVLGQALAEDIIAFGKQNYNWNDNEMEVEVLK